MFIGRETEIQEIKNTILFPSKHVLVYGNRRVGKTSLINQALKGVETPVLNFEFLKDSLKVNLDAFLSSISDENLIPSYVHFENFLELFRYLDSLNRRMIVFLDEYPYLYAYEKREKIDSIFQCILDQSSKNINFIFSGSHVGFMRELAYGDNALFGRFKTIIHLKEFDYLCASKFYPDQSNYDKAAFFSVFGGSPFVLSILDPKKNLKENIIDNLLNENSVLSFFLQNSYTSDLPWKEKADSLFRILGNSKLRYSHLEKLLGLEKNGLLSKQLKILLEMGFVHKNMPINRLDDAKKTTYSLSSNLMRFFYTYVYGKYSLINRIGGEAYFKQYIEPSINTFISYRFEEICLDYFSILIRKGLLKNIKNLGSYYYDDPIQKKNGEFDLVLEKEGGYEIIEVKYDTNPIGDELIDKEIYQVKQIKEIKVEGCGFVSINGFTHHRGDLLYQLDGDDIYFNRKN